MATQYILRLDDACERSRVENWVRMEQLLAHYNVHPLVAVIPECADPDFLSYEIDYNFWDRVGNWIEHGWSIAMHGYTHEHPQQDGGISPVNKRSEFAGVPLEKQREMIANGVAIMRGKGIDPQVFVAPLHTFDLNTIEALKLESNIRIISDTIATKPYQRYGMTFVPQQSGSVRAIPFPVVTFCYHPNIMHDDDFSHLENFLKKNHHKFIPFPLQQATRRRTLFEKILSDLYLVRRRLLFG